MSNNITFGLMILLLALPLAAFAEEEKEAKPSEAALEQRLLELQSQLAEMQKRHAEEMATINSQLEALLNDVAAIKKNSSAAPEATSPTEPTTTPPQDYGSAAVGAGGEVFNPKISVISDFHAGYAKQGDESADDALVREVELGFSGHVDTWGRYDLTIALGTPPRLEPGGFEAESELETEIEEGYFTFLTLPNDLQARVGKVRNRIGKTNPTHLHSLKWIDYPRVLQAYLGEEGISGSGASASWLAPWEQYSELTYELVKFNGEGSSGIFDEEADGYSHILHANTFLEFGDNYNLEVGLSSALSPTSALLNYEDTWLNGVDLTYRWDPTGDGTYRRLEWRTELYGLRRTLNLDSAGDVQNLSREEFFGMFSSMSYRFNRTFEATGRYDYVEGPLVPNLKETSWSAYLTWWQSEYAFWRIGWMRTEEELENIQSDPVNRLLLQFSLSLGPHPAHKY